MWPFNWLLDTEPFTPRAACGCWTDVEVGVAVLANVLIFFAYSAIPLLLAYFVRWKPQAPHRHIFRLFAVFIASCGVSHALDACMYFWPAYRLLIAVETWTAVISVYTFFRLTPLLPSLLSMRMPEEFDALIARQREVEQKLRHTNRNLEHQLTLRDRLEKEVGFLRELELAKARKDSEVHRAIDRLDAITGTLERFFQATWPDMKGDGVATLPSA